MPAEYRDTDAFRGASFVRADLTGATLRDCKLGQLKIADSYLVAVNVVPAEKDIRAGRGHFDVQARPWSDRGRRPWSSSPLSAR
jgi:hypothetical protein